MTIVANLNDINENQRIMRVVDKKGLILSIGEQSTNEQIISFPLNFLSHYTNCEDNRRADKKESCASVNVNGVYCTVHACVPALISCWTLIDDIFDPYTSFKNSKFTQEADDFFIIVSTVGKVKKIFQDIVSMIESIQVHYSFQNSEPSSHGLVFKALSGKVNYYSEQGIDISEWNAKTDITQGADITVIQVIFHKEECFFADENEFRYAILLNNFRLCSESKSASMSHMGIMKSLVYPQIILNEKSHYIDVVYSLPGMLPDSVRYQAMRTGISISDIEPAKNFS